MIEKVLYHLLRDLEVITPSRLALKMLGIIAVVAVYTVLSLKFFGFAFGKTNAVFFVWAVHIVVVIWIATGVSRVFEDDEDR